MWQYFDKFGNHILNGNSQKIFEKKKNASSVFLGLGSVRKNYRKCVGAGAPKVENLVCFFSNFDLYFSNIQRVRKRCKIYIESIGIYCKNVGSIESMEVTTLESNVLPFHFA